MAILESRFCLVLYGSQCTGFTSDFTFSLSNPSADGIAFVINNSSSNVGVLAETALHLDMRIMHQSCLSLNLYNSAVKA